MDITHLSEEDLFALKNQIEKRISLIQSERINFIDLFCGAGGLTKGLKMAGMIPVLGVDRDQHAINTYKSNHPEAKTYLGSVTDLDEEKLKELIQDKKIHLLVAGPPCHGFSTIRDDKNRHEISFFSEFCRLVKMIKPQYIIFENVTGLLSKRNEYTLITVLERFFQMGYEAQVQILEAQKYGVPQVRKRAFFLASNNGTDLTYPTPQFDLQNETGHIPPTTVGTALNEIESHKFVIKNHELHQSLFLDGVNLERLKCIPEGKAIRYKSDEESYLPDDLKLGVDWSTLREGRLREGRYRRLDRQAPAPTLNSKNTQYFHPTENRRFTVRELATLQSFPLSYEILGPLTQQVHQVGNSVPPLLAKAIGQEIIKAHFSTKKEVKEKEGFIDSLKKMRKSAFCYQENGFPKAKGTKKSEEVGVQMSLMDFHIE